jgi:hypothetical protein
MLCAVIAGCPAIRGLLRCRLTADLRGFENELNHLLVMGVVVKPVLCLGIKPRRSGHCSSPTCDQIQACQ